jgi:hypothetical protein
MGRMKMKILDLQPAQIQVILQMTLEEVRNIADALDGAKVELSSPDKEEKMKAVTDFTAMLDKLLDEFDHGTRPDV